MSTLVWFRSDLRVEDHPALHEAATRGEQVVGLFVSAPEQWRRHDWGPNKVDFVLRSVDALAERLASLGIPLLRRSVPTFGDVPELLSNLTRELGCVRVVWNRELEANETTRDGRVRERLEAEGVEVAEYHDQTLFAPGSLVTSSGRPYSVFTPFYRKWAKRIETEGVRPPLPAPQEASGLPLAPERAPEPRAKSAIGRLWPAGELEARSRLARFLESAVHGYHRDRDELARPATSELSPYLAVGSISPHQLLHAALVANRGELRSRSEGAVSWMRQLAWREFYRHVLVGFPRVGRSRSFRREAERIRWRRDPVSFEAWQQGRTGFPFVDAGMRELAETGFMHNRLRMITAAFLTKDLLIDWRQGEAHFARRLVDLDHANNNGGWQWAASTGTDAAPYFRVFNPWTQGRRFDPRGDYIRRWVPELRRVPAAALHDAEKLAATAPREYPSPIVEHAVARERALHVFGTALRSGSAA